MGGEFLDNSQMRFLIAGVGAIGSVYLAFLTKAGYTTCGLVKKGKVKNRIEVEGIWGAFSVPVKTVESVSELDFIPDLIVVSVKSYDTEQILKTVKPVVGANTLLLIAQNGYGNYEKAVSLYGEERVVLSRIIFGAEQLGEEKVRVTVCADDVVIGDPSGKIEEGFLKNLAELFSKAGIPTRYNRQVYAFLWDKIIYNCALNPLSALLEVNYGSLAYNPQTKDLMNRIVEEIFLVMEAGNIKSLWSSSKEYLENFYSKLIPSTADHYASMLKDIKRGKTEIDALNGAICRLGKKFGVETPVNEVITSLVKAKELISNFKGGR